MEIEFLKSGDSVAIVSPSSGILGESFVAHELNLGTKRLKEMGLNPVFMQNSLKGLDYLNAHPEKRAEDLKQAFLNNNIKAIISAIGGNDSYRLIPYLANDKEFVKLVKNNPKIFMGYSDTTTLHVLFNYLGLNTFYGPAFITDFAEFEKDMLPYTKKSLKFLFNPKLPLKIESSEIWYEERTDFSKNAVGTNRVAHRETHGYEVLKGSKEVSGKLYGGCIEILSRLTLNYKNLDDLEFENLKQILKENPILPNAEWFKDKILFIETSNEKANPDEYRKMIKALITHGMMKNIKGLIVGKPMDETYYNQYKQVLCEELAEFDYPIMYNFNFGHSFPRMILPYGATAALNPTLKSLTITKL